jgi:CubicO group peptidase (beta-lactamase class C family)
MATLDKAAVDKLLQRAQRDVDEGLLPSCQVALGLDGKVVLHEAFGDATVDSRYTIYSATKPFVASVIWQLLGTGELTPETRVADLLPSFGTNGKDVITLDHVLLHTSGFPHAPLGPPLWDTHEGRAEAFGRWRLNWDVGTAFEYHPTSAHWVLAELIHAVTGQDHTDAVRSRIVEPLGLPGFVLGADPDELDGVKDLALCGEPATPDELEAALGIRELDLGEVTNDALLSLNHPSSRRVGVPGGTRPC